MAYFDKNIGGLVLGLRAVDNQQATTPTLITGNTITKTQNGSMARSAVAVINIGGGDGNDSVLFHLEESSDGSSFTTVAGTSFVAQDGDSHQEVDINDLTQLEESLRLVSDASDQTIPATEIYISASLILGGFDVDPQ